MIKGDIFTSPIEFALQETMKKFENSEDENDKIIYETLRRSKVIWENIRIHGLEICGMTYEQFCDQFNEKNHIVFLSDDEAGAFNKAVQVMSVIRN